MKKGNFNDGYGLTEAVLDGLKDMTRRIISKDMPTTDVKCWGMNAAGGFEFQIGDNFERIIIEPQYHIGEVVAVAQNYENAGIKPDTLILQSAFVKVYERYRAPRVLKCVKLPAKDTFGWKNKLYVKAGLMPHLIKITDVRVERLQDISDDDCLREGVYCDKEGGRVIGCPFGIPFYYTFKNAMRKDKQLHWTTPREAFANLIDKISGKGTWERNPWVFVYEFKLVK